MVRWLHKMPCRERCMMDEFVTYEAFGAVGDGMNDDLPAICSAHEHANSLGLPVRTKSDATYHLGRRALTVIIGTDTDWNTSRFTIDDSSQPEDHKKPLFEVRSLLKPEQLQIDQLRRDQDQIEARPEHDCHVMVENDTEKVFIRKGKNRNNGIPKSDCFILRRDGSVEGPVDWDYDTFTRISARPIDDTRLTLRGGIFTTIANRMKQDVGYNYWSRNILITRSNTEIAGVSHYIAGETAVGHPYSGFLNINLCANITLRDCFMSGHKTYSTIGVADEPVSMGSYDISVGRVVNFTMINCHMNHILDRSRWGVIGSNLCKNILLQGCTLSRMDTHMGVSGTYTIRDCKLGYMGLNAIGRGILSVEDSELYGNALVSFRSDYGSTWEGDLVIRNSRWVPSCGDTIWPYMIEVHNDGTHDFGYPCSMPRDVTIDGVVVDDTNHPDDYTGMFIFADPSRETGDGSPPTEPPFPYSLCRRVKIRNLTTKTGKKWSLSPNREMANSKVVEEG
jgi:hypothetical protein